MTSSDWISLAIAGLLSGLAVDRWVHRRESDDEKLSADLSRLNKDIQRIQSEIVADIERLRTELDRIHEKASEMASEWNKKGGDLSIQVAVLEARLAEIQHVVSDIRAVFDRRPPYSPT